MGPLNLNIIIQVLQVKETTVHLPPSQTDTLRRVGALKSGLVVLVSLIVLLKSWLEPYANLLRDLCMPHSPHYNFRVLLPGGFEHHMGT